VPTDVAVAANPSGTATAERFARPQPVRNQR
jgi:hypothetical protein